MMNLFRRLLGIPENKNFVITYEPIRPNLDNPEIPFVYHTLVTASEEYYANRMFDTDPIFAGFRRVSTEEWNPKNL